MRRERGFTLISAIFLVTAMSALGAFMLRFYNAQQLGSYQDVEAAGVYQAALAGADYGAFQALRSGICAASVNVAFPGGYVATVACAASGPYAEPAGNVTVYRLRSLACNKPLAGACPGTPDGIAYVERGVGLTVSR